MRQVAKTTGQDPAELGLPNAMDMPLEFHYLWRCFHDLASSRMYAAHGPCPISYTEIEAFGRLMGVPLSWWHVKLLKDLDGLWLQVQYARLSRTHNADQVRGSQDGDPDT